MIAALVSVLFAADAASPTPPEFICENDISSLALSGEEQALEDRLWEETLAYLEGVHGLLTTPAGCLDGPRAVVQTLGDDGRGPERECMNRHRDVELMIKHVRAVLEHPEQARACFDAQIDYTAFDLFAPSEAMREEDAVAAWIGRPTLEDFYAERTGEIGDAGRELARDFSAIVHATRTPEAIGSDLTANALGTLWRAVGWIPFYADNEAALNPRFRGGYAYAEVMGPWGLLRVRSIDGERVGAEIGMTVQLGDTFYPYHYHHPQEWYATLTPAECQINNRFAVMHWDNPAFDQERTEDGWRVFVPGEGAEERFMRQGVEEDWLTYFERNAIHAFEVAEACGEGPGGLVSVWARTTARDNDQTTRLCAPSHGAVAPVAGDDAFECALTDWEY